MLTSQQFNKCIETAKPQSKKIIQIIFISSYTMYEQGRRQKIFQGGQWKKDRKLAKTPKNSTICLFQGRGAMEKKTEK